MGQSVVLEPDEATRSLAYMAFCAGQEPLDGSARSAAARDRVRCFQKIRAIDQLPPDLRELWDWHIRNQVGFARLPFEQQKSDFMFIKADEAQSDLGIPGRVGRRSYAPYHAAGAHLLGWWEMQGRKVTANRGYGSAKEGAMEPQPSRAVQFLADEFMLIASRYDAGTLDAYRPQACDLGNRLLSLTPDRALDIAFKSALSHLRNQRPTLR